MAAMSFESASCGSSADLIFKTRVLRPFLHHPGAQPWGEQTDSFFKAGLPVPSSSSQSRLPRPAEGDARIAASGPARAPLALRPFQDEAARRFRERRTKQLRAISPASSPRKRNGISPGPSLREPTEEAMRIGTAGVQQLLNSKLGEQRRKPVYDCFDLFDEEDPCGFNLPEDPDDTRVRLPAHRIGDPVPGLVEGGTCSQSAFSEPSREMRSRHAPAAADKRGGLGTFAKHGGKNRAGPGMQLSRSSPNLLLQVKKLPLQARGKQGTSQRSQMESTSHFPRYPDDFPDDFGDSDHFPEFPDDPSDLRGLSGLSDF